LSSCLSTLYPIFHERDVVFNQQLLGSWKYIEDNQRKFIEFKKIPRDRSLELTDAINKISDKGYLVSKMDSLGIITSQSFVFVAKIGKKYYLDFYPAELPSQKQINKFYKSQYVKTHISYLMDFKDNDHFEMKRFDRSFLDKLISDNKINIRHEVVEGKNIITANTDELQKFIIQYSDNPKAFMTGVSCVRSVYY
jgi:hypothetical protein